MPAAAPGRGLESSTSLLSQPLVAVHALPQDKAQVLSDVRSIVAEQLGTDLDKVTPETK